MQPTISEFLRDAVYPKIDAVEAGLLDSLNPSHRLSGAGSYLLVCPACGAKEAYYYPHSSHIHCPRKNECGEVTSLWDAMLRCGYANSEIVKVLCDTARVEPPKSDRHIAAAKAKAENQPVPVSPGKAIFAVTQHLAQRNPTLLAELQKDRGYTDAQMKEMRLGVYTTPQEVLSLLEQKGISRKVAIEKGYIEVEDGDPLKLRPGLTGRVVGYWPHLDGDVRLWGRLPSGRGEKGNPKYRFAIGMKKDIPYLFSQRKQTVLVGVEGTFDCWSLQFSGIWGMAVGQSSISEAQAGFLASRGVTEVAHMVDGDTAGFEGGLNSIRNCESVGIVTSIIPLGKGMDDADDMRRSGRSAELHSLVEGRINAGEYLARMCSYYLSCTPPDLRGIGRVQSIARNLTPVSAAVWADFSASLGLQMDPEREAGLVFGGLLQAGLAVDEAIRIVTRRTGYKIKIEMESLHG